MLKTDDQVNVAVAPFAVAGGEVALHGALDAGRAPPALAFDLQADAVSLGPLWQALAPRIGIAGTVSGRVVLAARADTIAGALTRMTGEGEFVLVDGLIQGVDIASGASGRQSQTPVERLAADIRAEEGVVGLDDVRLDAGALSFDGLGRVDLQDMRIMAELFTTTDPRGLAFLRIEGPLSEPRMLWQSLGLGEPEE